MKDICKSKKQLIKELEEMRRKTSQGKTGTLEEYPVRTKADLVSDAPNYKRDKEALLLIRKAIDSATDAIGLSDPEGHHVYQNKAFTNLFEYTAEELAAVGNEAAFAVKSTAREVFGSIMSGRSWSGEVEMRAKSGRAFGLFLRANAIKDDVGKIVGLVGVFTDITERKRLEYQLRKKHDELQLILDSIPAYVFYKDKDGKMLNINKAATALAYVPKEKLLQKTVFDLIPETADKYNRDDMEVIRSGQPKINIEESLELPGGVRWLKTDKIPIKDDDGNIVGLLGFSVDITDLRKAQEELLLIRKAVQSSSDAIGMSDPQGRHFYQNESYGELFGYEVDELNALGGAPVIFKDYKIALDIFDLAMRGGQWNGEVEMASKDGRNFPVFLRVNSIKDEAGNIIGLIGAHTDVSERKRAEAEITVLSNAFRAALDPILILDLEGKVRNVNEAARRLFETEELGVSALDYVAPEDKEKITAAMQGLIAGSSANIAEFTIVTKSGRRVLIEATGSLMINANGKATGFVVVERDITERKKAEEALRESEMRFRHILENSQDASYRRNLKAGRYDYLSPVITKLTGYSVDEMSTMSEHVVTEHIHPDDREQVARIFGDALSGLSRTYRVEYRFMCRDGQYRWMNDLGSIMLDERGKQQFLVGSLRDITERKQVEAEIIVLSNAFRAALDPVLIFDMQGNVVNANEAAHKLFERNDVGVNALESVAPEDKERIAVALQGLITSGRHSIVQFSIVTRSGRRVPLEASGNIMLDASGKPVGIVVVERDLTERRRAEEALREANEKLRVIFDSIGEAVTVVDLDGNVVDANKEALRLHGFGSKDEIIGRKASEMVAPVDRERSVNDAIKSLKSPYLSGRTEYKLIDAGGREFDGEFNVAVIKDNKGKPAGFIGIARDISERKKAEEALRKSEEKYRDLVDNERDVILSVDALGFITSINPAVKGWGFTPEEILGKNFIELVPEDWREIIAVDMRKALLEAGEMTAEIKIVSKNGEVLPIEYSAKVIQDEGKYAGVRCIVRDIKERKKAEEALHDSEERFRLAVNATKDGLWEWNIQTNQEFFSPRWCEIIGYSFDDPELPHTYNSWASRIHPDDYDHVISAMNNHLEKGTRYDIDYRHRHKSGEYRWQNSKGQSVLDKSGKPTKMVGCISDISERKRAEEALRGSEERYRLLAENATDVIWIVSMDMRLTYVSPSVTRLLGYTVEETLARAMDESYTPASFAAVTQAATEEIAIEQTGQGDPKRSRILELELYRKDGTIVPVEAHFTFLRDAEGKAIGMLAMVRDITERKKAEEDLKRHAKRVEALYGVAQVVSQSSKLDTMLKDALGKVCDAMDTESGCIFMLDFDENALKLKACKGVSENTVQQFSTIVMTEQGMEGLVKLTGPITEIDETKDVADVDMVQKLVAEIGRNAIAVTPFLRGKDLQGLVVVFTTKERTFSGEDQELLKAISSEMSIGINNMMLLEKTKEMSVTDELTGLYNRRHFFETLEVEMNRAGRTKRPFSLVMLDLDGFKEYNDKYGHTNGDSVLQTISQMLKSSIRKSDMAFRYGGDEFALILPLADAERAKKIVQRARAKWQKAPLTQSRIFGGHVGFSTGIAEYPENAESADGLIFLADAALYQAKKKGYEDKLVSELRTLSTDIMDVATQDQVYALAATVDARDPYTYGHSQRVAEIAMSIGKQVGLSAEDLAKLHAAALLHDIGKVGVPDAILTKMGKPTPEEWDVIKKHCSEGARIVSYVKELSTLVPIILHHHEWYDGSGYPGGLKGIDIPSGARITSVADAYDTMVTKRPYRDVISPKKACEELKRNAGVQFDPVIVDTWCRLMDKASKKDK